MTSACWCSLTLDLVALERKKDSLQIKLTECHVSTTNATRLSGFEVVIARNRAADKRMFLHIQVFRYVALRL